MTDLVPVGVDRDAILRHLNLNPNDVNTQALLLICQRYGLDPLLKHMVLISGKPYVTRDGYLHIAHASGQLDGVEIIDEGATNEEWWAKVAVHRKDMAHPFTYKGRYPKDGQQRKFGPEMAVKCAEVMAMRRAFDVTGVAALDEQWDEHIEVEPRDEAACPTCGEIISGALSDPKPMRAHMVDTHDWVRLDDGKVAPPKIADEPPTAGASSAAGPEPAPPSQQSGPATIEHTEAFLIRLDAMTAETRRLCEDALAAGIEGRFPYDLTEADLPEVEALVAAFEEKPAVRNERVRKGGERQAMADARAALAATK